MSKTETSTDVHVPIRTAYDQWTQFASFPQFMNGVERVEQLDDTHTRWTIKIAGVTRTFDATITEQLPDERVAWTSTSGPTHAGVVTFHRIDDTTTRLMLQLETDPEGVVENVADKVGVVGHQATSDLERFKAFIESEGAASGSWRQEVDRPGA